MNPSITDAEMSLAGDILIVDDTPADLRLLADMLAEQGYRVRTAPDGSLALKSAQAIPPDLILLDIKMPDMNGYEVCEQLKADPRTHDIPIIFISVLDQTEDKVKAFTFGGVDYITKPFQGEEVLVRVETHLTLHMLQHQLAAANVELQESNDRLKSEIEKRIQAEAKLQELAITDSLTELYNRRYFFELAEQEINRTQRYQHDLAAMMIDLDHFKQINDQYGHLVGDYVLQTVARCLCESIRETDILGRYGGEEFVVLLPETSLSDGQEIAERLCQTVSANQIATGEHTLSITTSIGIASLEEDDITIDILIDRADQALFTAKQAGRNQVVVWQDQ